MKKLICLIALAVGLVVPAWGSAAPQAASCSNLGYIKAAQKANIKAGYANNLAEAELYSEAATAFYQAVQIHARGPLPCTSAMRNVRATFASGLRDWYAGARAWSQGSSSYGLRLYKRGTAKIGYATEQIKLINQG